VELAIGIGLVALGLLATGIVLYRQRGERDRRLGHRKKKRIDLFGEKTD
jgi:hypothetical protein